MELKVKRKILILIDWYLPGRKAGGPVKSVESLVWAMKDHYDFYILTRDTDLGTETPYPGIKRDVWIEQEDGSKVMYLDSASLSADYLKSKINSLQYDFLYINSYYSKWFSIVPLRLHRKGLVKGKVVLACRGMLSYGALQIKPLKKKVFIRISSVTGLHEGIRWHATYPDEVNEIRKHYGVGAEIVTAANFSKPLPVVRRLVEKQRGSLRLFYLSRVSRVKNLHIALLALKEMKGEEKIVYDIYGAIEDNFYKAECEDIIRSLPPSISVSFKGELNNRSLPSVLPDYHFLLLPTSNENFGHSIFESLQCGCPVIISNRTPWRNLQEKNAGWDLDPDPKALCAAIFQACQMDQQRFEAMSESARALAASVLHNNSTLANTLKLFG